MAQAIRRVALETNGLYTNKAGVARYIQGLRKGFQRVALNGFRIEELAWPVENLHYRQPARALKTLYRELVWAKALAPIRLRRERPDLLHSTVNVLVRPPPATPHVVTLHDLAVCRHPERFRRWLRFAGRRRLAQVAHADRVICISRSTADEAIQLLGIPARRIEVVWNGCDFHPEEGPPGEAEPEFKLPERFFLFVGSLEPGKNLELLRQAYEQAASQGHRLPALVIVGARWEGVAREGRPPENWYFAGRQPDAVLVYLYRRALALVFPSKYEGFGLPVVEAMALGCPVICSPVTSLKEIGEGAVRFADQTASAYLKCMEEVSADPALRGELIQAGHEKAASFSWTRCAQETLGVYQHVLG